MNQHHVLIAVAILVLAGSAQAQECSGGSDGGMDATGNDCNQPPAIVAAAPRPVKSAAARATTGAARSGTTPIRTPTQSDRVARVTPRRRR